MPIYSNSKDQALKAVKFWTKKVAKFYYLTELTNQSTENGIAAQTHLGGVDGAITDAKYS